MGHFKVSESCHIFESCHAYEFAQVMHHTYQTHMNACKCCIQSHFKVSDSCHIFESCHACHACECVWMSLHPKRICRNAREWCVALASCHTYETHMSSRKWCITHIKHIWMRASAVYKLVMSRVWISHVMHMNESCHACVCVTSRTWLRHVTYGCVISHTLLRLVTHMNDFSLTLSEWCQTYKWFQSDSKWVVSHI